MRGKGALPPPLLQDLAIPVPAAGAAGGMAPPLAVLVTTHAVEEMAWVAAAASSILIIHSQPEPASVLIHALAAIVDLDGISAGDAGDQRAGDLVRRMSPQPSPGVTANVASALRRIGAYPEAMRLYSDSLGALASWLGADHWAMLELRLQRAHVMSRQGMQDYAEREMLAVYEKRLATFGQGHPATQHAFAELTQVRREHG
jgi:hypothetical protein